MILPAEKPSDIMPSANCPTADMRAANLIGTVSVKIKDLFPEIKQGYLQDEGISEIREATEKALADIQMDSINQNHTVNILCSEHGFYLLGGEHYCEMLKTIKDAVQQRTGCKKIRLRVAGGMGSRESNEVIRHFRLTEYFGKRVRSMNAFDKGIPIETEIGTLYGLAGAYDADWIIHAFHDEPRDLYFYRMIDRAIKAFAMSYARFETRSVYHGNFGNRSGAFIQRAIFDSPFVQKKFAFGCFLRMTPAGITGVDADSDLYRLGKDMTVDLLRDYGKILQLFSKIEECTAVLDGGRYAYYLHAGGIVFGALENAEYDAFDLSQPAALAYYDLIGKLSRGETEEMDNIMFINPALKAVVINQAWPGIPMSDLPMFIPTIVVGEKQADMWRMDAANPSMMDLAQKAKTLEEAVTLAEQLSGTDKVLIFDGSFGYINLSASLAEELLQKAPEVNQKVNEQLLPLWLRQRGIDPDAANMG